MPVAALQYSSSFATGSTNPFDNEPSDFPIVDSPGTDDSSDTGTDTGTGDDSDTDDSSNSASGDKDGTVGSASGDTNDIEGDEDKSEEEEGEEERLVSLSIDPDDPEQMQVLIDNRFTGLNPANTTVNLFDYTSYMSDDGDDEQNSSALPSEWLGSSTDPNINTGHALTFGNGMNNDMGYWNAGSGSGMGDFAKQNPGFQNIVQPLLGSDGYPQLSIKSMEVDGYSDVNNWGTVVDSTKWPLVGGYDNNPPLYANATRINAAWSNGQPCFPNAGGKNISDTVQNQWNKDTSLAYLFDPSQTNVAGRTQTHTDVTGLFQLDNGYYYYNMRDNFAQYTPVAVEGKNGTIPANSFILYDAPAGLRTDGENSIGNFFPFNTGEEVFKVEGDKLVSDVYASNKGNPGTASNQGQNKPYMNHNLGMSMETSFRQPVSGTVGDNPMTFEFIGDDDLWVFIDDVLVLDLGGIHSELYGTINFSTGDVNLGTAFSANGNIANAPEPVRTTTIKDMFEAAGVDTSTGFRGNTFSSNTSHTLKMFYFERGNYDSSLSVRFNLQPELFQEIKKVDQDGNPVSDAVFDLYPVTGTSAATTADATLDNIAVSGTRIATMTTGSDGIADIKEANGEPFNFADRVVDDDIATQLYVLRERSAPAGYRMMPIDILLRYDQETGTFVVNNRYDTGSYASFNSYVTQIAPDRLAYGHFDTSTGTIVSSDTIVPIAQQSQGLVVGIPTLKQGSSTRWDPMYGSNNEKLSIITYDQNDTNAMRGALLEAALYQAYLSNQPDSKVPGWYMEWTDEGRLSSYHEAQSGAGETHVVCTLSDLPGNPTRYRLNNSDGDMQMVYGIISSDVFGSNAANMTEAQKYAALAQRVQDKLAGVSEPSEEQLKAAVAAVAQDIAASSTSGVGGEYGQRGFSAIEANNPDQFERNFRTMINVPNEQRELRVWKIDQNGDRVNGAVFGLFSTKAEAQSAVRADVDSNSVVTRVYNSSGSAVTPYAAGVTGDLRGSETKYQGDDLEGMLIFAPYVTNGAGAANTLWTHNTDSQNGRVLYLKEIQAPPGFNPNDTIVPVVIGQYGIYADAGNIADGVDVLAGVGKLSSTMTKYAASPNVNLTLRYIISTMQAQASGAVPDGATSVSFDTFNGNWRNATQDDGQVKQMELEYGENALVDYGSPTGFTEQQLAQGIGYIDAAGNERPLFVTETGFIRATAQQNTAAVQGAQASGEYQGVNADLIPGQDLTNLFMIRNTVRVTDVKRPAPQIMKVDQNGKAVAGAQFQLFSVNAPAGTTDANLSDVTLDDVAGRIGTTPIAVLETDATGTSLFQACDSSGTSTGDVLDFATRAAQNGMNGGRLYVLQETKRPAGFRQMSTDLLIRYEPTTGMLTVNNRYASGASASFISFVTVDSDIHYADYSNGTISPTTETMPTSEMQNGCVVTIPTMLASSSWYPVYGDTTSGYQRIASGDNRALLEAALRQASETDAPWHLDWNESLATLTGNIEGLPGSADDYRLNNPDGGMQMVYASISSDAFVALGITGDTTSERYAALGSLVKSRGIDSVINTIMSTNGGFRIIDASDFDRSFQPIIYIPNEQRELRIWKLDEEGVRVDGAVFALFESRNDAERASSAVVSGNVVASVTDGAGNALPIYAAGITGVPHNGDPADNQHGTIVFAPYVENGEGCAHTSWIDSNGGDLTGKVLYMREVQAPYGYDRNETIIPVVVGRYGVYADAGAAGDGVDVLAGVGKLAAPMNRWASSTDIDITLRYIISREQEQPSLAFNSDGSIDDGRVVDGGLDFDSFNSDWVSTDKTMNLEYGNDNALVSYGHPGNFTLEELADGIGYIDAYGDERPLFRTDTGFIRTTITQDTEAMERALAEAGAADLLNGDDLSGEDLTGLFTIRNTIRVVDQRNEDYNENPPGDEGDEDHGSGMPFTGDNMLLWVFVLCAVAIISAIALSRYRKKNGEFHFEGFTRDGFE